jgi:hypothetical protein
MYLPDPKPSYTHKAVFRNRGMKTLNLVSSRIYYDHGRRRPTSFSEDDLLHDLRRECMFTRQIEEPFHGQVLSTYY